MVMPFLGLMARIRRRGLRSETLACRPRQACRLASRYTQKNDQRHASHLFPLPDPPDRLQPCGGSVSTLPGNPRPRLFRRHLTERLGFLPPVLPNDGCRCHLVSRRLGRRSALRGGVDPPAAARSDPASDFSFHHDAGRPRYGGAAAGERIWQHGVFYCPSITAPWCAGCCAASAPPRW